jgi:UDP-N-acetylglucosamine--N-acetylmuramyl-(pentapeptide) pyrophosphoryl-undecaprenol N-acetylglucosamine transferase
LTNNSTISSSAINPRIIIAGGGTGGHIFPALAIAEAIRNRCSADILFVGAKGKMEMEKIPQAGYKIIGINIAGYNRSSLLKNLSLPLKLLKSFFQVNNIIKSFRPQAVIGVGGYSSYPVLRLAQSKNIPTFIHESNSFAGKSNMMLGKKATKIFVAFEGMSQFFPSKKVVISGNPVRNIFSTSNAIRSEALEYFGLKPEKKTVLVVGGSLGAMSINKAIEQNIEYFNNNDIQLIWQTGKLYAPKAANTETENNNIWSNAFIDRMELAYTAADIVVSRSGAMAVAELCVVGKPVIFVPYPHAAEDHQTSNAQALVRKNAALMIKDADVNDKLIGAIDQLLNDDDLRTELRNNISKLKNTQADERIADEILAAI